MSASNFHTFHTSSERYGARKSALVGLLPYLPYLPYLTAHMRARAGAHTRAHVRAHVIPVWKVWRYGIVAQDQAFRAPYLFHTSERYGT